MYRLLFWCFFAILGFTQVALGGENGYLGSDVCAGCHKDIAQTQFRTNMARTWKGDSTPRFPANYIEKHSEGPAPEIHYELKRTGPKLQFQVQMPGQSPIDLPVETMVGGSRHGISFLLRMHDLEGSPLPRAPLIEARYFHSSVENQLAFSLGFPEDKPASYETAFGRVLMPYLEKRCISCHVAPRKYGTRVETGVACENCHGPGQPHLAALAAHSQDHGILNPKKLPVPEQMRPCSQCHAGSSLLEDPVPQDLLISDQVTALKNSECWRQTGGQITCVNCHNPHQDAPRAVLQARAVRTCLRCHSTTVANHAGICPVNRTADCVGCHMADEKRGAFTIAEHWIRVQPGQAARPATQNPAWRTRVTPRHLFLRTIVLDDQAKASAIRQQILSGGSFFELARANSVDRNTAMNGGYAGDLDASQLDPAWSAAVLKLQPGEISDVIEANGKYLVIQRMPRNFRANAQAKFDDAMNLRKQGRTQEAAAELIESLKIYPYFLRALTYLGVTYAEAGNPQTAAGILRMAVNRYPQDAGAHFNLGIAYGAMGNEDEIPEYKRTIEIDPDYVPAYLNWGGALYAKGQYDEAIQVYRQGINVNPLHVSLHYSLGLALEKVNKQEEAEAEMTLAQKIDPKVAGHP